MSKLNLYGVCITSGYLATSYFSVNSGLGVYFRAFLLSLILFASASLLYRKFIYPFWTSPLIGLPLIPRQTWKDCIGLLQPPICLEAMDSIPNDGLLRHIAPLNQEVVVVTTPNIAMEFLQHMTADYETIHATRGILNSGFGTGIMTAEGIDHQVQRKTLAPAFGALSVGRLYPLLWRKAFEMISLIKDEIHPRSNAGLNATVNMNDWSTRVSIDIVAEAGFGSTFNALSHPFNPLNKQYRSAFIDESSTLSFPLSIPSSSAFANIFPSKRLKARLEGYKFIRSWIQEIIEERKKDLYHNVDVSDYLHRSGHTDIISAVINKGTLNTDDLLEQALALLGAGSETSATALAWGIHELSQPSHLHYQRSLRAEIRARLPSPRSSMSLTPELLDSLPLLNAISREVLRYHAPVTTISRRASRDTVLGGIRIPKHTHVMISPWAMNQSREIWGADGRVFKPERWLNDRMGGSGEELAANIVFGYGSRSCIGKGFAQAEHKALLAALVGTFEFRQVGNIHVDPVNVFGSTGKILDLNVETRFIEGWE